MPCEKARSRNVSKVHRPNEREQDAQSTILERSRGYSVRDEDLLDAVEAAGRSSTAGEEVDCGSAGELARCADSCSPTFSPDFCTAEAAARGVYPGSSSG